MHIACTGLTLGPENKHKNEGWQDRLLPVLGAMCNALPLDKQDRELNNLALANKRSRVDHDPVAYSGNMIDQINKNMATVFVAAEITRRSAAELGGREVFAVLPFWTFA
ncbi:hypothetical protein PQR37_35300 [Paraburkholderia nemoris]|uniref:hypothetical protein n=1 Tax=Paraburkholderia nemoris TaxID=2793076 RepID=UPI0038B6E936